VQRNDCDDDYNDDGDDGDNDDAAGGHVWGLKWDMSACLGRMIDGMVGCSGGT